MVYSQSSPQPIDREQVRQQLATLGYKAGDTVYLRAFYPDSDPRKTFDAGRKAFATKLDHLIKHATTFQAEGRGIYLVVNGGGHKDKDVTQARAIFYEHDSLDKSLQLDLWKDLGLPEPTLQVDTGGKSIHSYWVFDESVVVEDWRELQTDLLEFADADRSLKNPSRVMRLAGAWHSSGNQSVIVRNSGKRYTYADLRAIVPTPEKTEPLLFQPKLHPPSTVSRCEDITIPVPASVPLEECLAKSSRNLLNGISEGGRNEAGAKLARDVIGTANYLRTIGQQFNGDPRQLLEDFAARCNPPLPKREIETVWKSAEGDNPKPACKPEGVENCIRGWYWKNHAEKMGGRAISSSNNVVTHPRFALPNTEELREELIKLIKAGTAGSSLTAAIFGLAKGGNTQPIWRLYKEISEEIERADQRADRKRDVENLLTIGNRRLTLENYLHPHLAEPIKKVATWMAIDPEAVLTHLLPIAAGLINPNSRVVAKKCINFVQPLLLYTGVVAVTGGRKTPTLDIVKQPLVKLQSAEDALHEQALQRYEAELQAVKETTNSKRNGGGEFPQKPKPVREFYLDNATVESVDKVKCQQPNNGLTLIKDELSGLFASHGAYKGGKGADKESYLSGWNGGGVKKNRAGDGSRVSLARDSLSITGGIQPDKLRELLGDFSDSQGEWARFLFYSMPMRPFKIPRDDTSYYLDELLADIYEKIDALPVLKLHFEKLGQTYFDDWHDEKDEQKRAETRPGLQAAIAKMPGQAVRLIGLLHILWEVASGSAEVPEEIPQAIVKSGCKLADFYLGQVTILQGDGDVEDGELAPTLRKLLGKVADLKTLTASQARRTIRDLRKTDANKVRQLFLELKMMGLAETQGKGSQLALVSKELTNSEELQKQHKPYSVDVLEDSSLKELTTVDKKLTNNQWSQTNAESGLQDTKSPTVDKVDTFETLDSNTPPPQTAEPIDIPDLNGENPKMIKDVVNLSTIGTENLSQCEIEEVDTPSTIGVNSSENVNSSPEESIAPPEPETAPTEPESSEIEPEMGVADYIFEAIKEAIATQDRAAARFAWQKIKNSPTKKEAVKAKLTEEEVLNFKILVATGWLKGMRVKYVGTKFESLAGVELTIDKIDGNGITCTKPDGSYITDLDKEDLVKFEQSEGGA